MQLEARAYITSRDRAQEKKGGGATDFDEQSHLDVVDVSTATSMDGETFSLLLPLFCLLLDERRDAVNPTPPPPPPPS